MVTRGRSDAFVTLSWNNCDHMARTVSTVVLPEKHGFRKFLLQILDLPHTEEPDDFISAVGRLMFPSFYNVLWTMAFPSSSLTSFPKLPPDICLQLDLMHTLHPGRFWLWCEGWQDHDDGTYHDDAMSS